ncbi:MAG: DMT family transporter [Cyanobacteriota bacterium]|nr:DMT family transporter [Cyanobacteriota bacterium]
MESKREIVNLPPEISAISEASSPKLPRRSEDFWAFVSLLSAPIAFSWVPALTKWGAMEISPETTIFDRFFLTTLMLGLGIGGRHVYRQLTQNSTSSQPLPEPPTGSLSIWTLLALSGTFLAGMLLALAWSLTRTTVANCELINNLTPIFTVFGAWFWFQQHFNRRFLLGCAIAISGLFVIGFNDFHIGIETLQGDGLALLSALLLASYLLGVERLRTHLKAETVLLGCFGWGTPLTLIVLAINQQSLFPNTSKGWIAIVSMSVSGLLAQGLLLYSLKRFSSGLVSLIFLVTPFTTAFIAWIMFSEALSLSNLLAFCIVILGLFVSISSSSTTQEIDKPL